MLTERVPEGIEWPTLLVAGAVYLSFGLVTWHYAALPWWLVLPLGGFLVAWHGSLQHEVAHGHPTPWAWVNEALIFPSLWLWLPFRLYRSSHLKHHENEYVTDPLADPESYYVTPEAWARMSRLGRAGRWVRNTLAGRLLLEPAHAAWRLLSVELRRLARGDTGNAGAWLLHFGGCGVVLIWVLWVCRIPLLDYLLIFAYPGMSVTLLRSFLEHRAHARPEERNVVVEAGWVMSLLFLNNNLHALHHAEPGTSWYALPTRYRSRRQELLAANGGYRYRGYGEIVARFLFRPKEPPAYPLKSATS